MKMKDLLCFLLENLFKNWLKSSTYFYNLTKTSKTIGNRY